MWAVVAKKGVGNGSSDEPKFMGRSSDATGGREVWIGDRTVLERTLMKISAAERIKCERYNDIYRVHIRCNVWPLRHCSTGGAKKRGKSD